MKTIGATGDWWAGQIKGSLGDFVARQILPSNDFARTLITMIDSERDLERVATIRALIAEGRGRLVQGAALVAPQDLIALSKSGLFTGFDECWFLRGAPPDIRRPPGFIVAPLDLSSDPVPAGTLDWMGRMDCILGIGDGDGLNYVSRDNGISERIQGEAES